MDFDTSCLFTYQKVKGSSCFLFGYNWLLNTFVPSRYELHPTCLMGHLVKTIRMILNQTDVVKARHCIIFLFWLHQNASYLFIANWKSNGKSDSLRYLHQRTGVSAEQPPTWLSTFVITCLKHGWRCLSEIFIIPNGELLHFQKKVAEALKISPPGGWGA